MEFSKEAIAFVKERYFKKFPHDNNKQFNHYFELYKRLPIFKANQNIHEIFTNYKDRSNIKSLEDECVDKNTNYGDEYFDENGSFDSHIHWILRVFTQYYLMEAFKAMKIDLEDENLKELSLAKGTPGRIAKLWVGSNSEDTTELGSGRFNKEPYLSYFPANRNHDIIVKEVDLVSTCSHHFLPFSSLDGGKIIIAYRPNEYVLGISKLQRYTN